jgi:meiotically up-regulated gene 157 (Mug157) protein
MKDEARAQKCESLALELKGLIEQYGIVETNQGKGSVSECDCLGNYALYDDANIPSLLSIPYIGYADVTDEIYQNTRKFLLSPENPYYFEGKCAKGIGSRHTPEHYVWHMALVMQGMTSTDRNEKLEILKMIEPSFSVDEEYFTYILSSLPSRSIIISYR